MPVFGHVRFRAMWPAAVALVALASVPARESAQSAFTLGRRAFHVGVMAAPACAVAQGLMEGSSGFSSGDSEERLARGILGTTKSMGVRPRSAPEDAPVDELTLKLLEKSKENAEKNKALVMRRTLINGESARIFPGDGITVFDEKGVPVEISMEEYQSLVESGRIQKGSRDIKDVGP